MAYEIHIYAGTKPGAETESNVFINLTGTKGDSGKRKLCQSQNKKPGFRVGQVTEGSQFLPTILPLVSFIKDVQTENS